ncbi:hypothetical protein CEV33_4652, partial [Brucella grignonensis]
MLDDGVRDRRIDRVARALRGEQHEPVLFADGLELVLGEIAKALVGKCLPELIDHDNDAAAIDQLLDAVEE